MIDIFQLQEMIQTEWWLAGISGITADANTSVN